MTSSQRTIEAVNLSRYYGEGETQVRALDSVNFFIEKGEFVSIMGTSGSGKSTLLHLLGCLDRPTSGHLKLDGNDVSLEPDKELSRIRGKKLGFVFQSFNLIQQLDVRSNVELPMMYGRIPVEERHRFSAQAIDLVGLSDRAHHKPTELSGGQAQRVAIARALVNRPSLLLADEPTGNLDSKTGLSIMALFQCLNKAGLTIVMVTHDRNLTTFTSRIISMKDGHIESDGPVKDRRIVETSPEEATRIMDFQKSVSNECI